MDHKNLLDIELDVFESKIRDLDEAFRLGHACYYFDTPRSAYAIDIFSPEKANDSEESSDLAGFAAALEQILIFAFEEAPDEVIRKWGESHDEDKGPKAISLIGLVREGLINGRLEWDRKGAILGNTLGDMRASVGYFPEVDEFTVAVRVDSFEGSGVRRRPISSSRKFFDATLTHREVRRLIAKLEEVDDLITAAEEQNGGE